MRLARDDRSRGAATAGKQRETALQAHGGKSKCDSGSGNRQPLGCGRGGRRRGAVVAANMVEEGPHGSKCPRERAVIEGEGRGCMAVAVVATGRKKRQRPDYQLEGVEPEIKHKR
ncbi:hypothetical protein B296_00002854 [Ensete ventricosum]|uniref:Uncharacterized protein n=1 Tax=Ensete ventricosum TaxID=4639 RepID=A0A427AYX9_ENSVE|nr:hypothetical protein B296_00002854 [Ensete ventricosum]